MSDNDAEELLPVTAFEKVIKTTIRQAASPVTGQDMWEAYKAAIPGATVTVSPEGAMPRKWVLAGFSAAVLVWLGGLIALAASVGWLADNAHYIATIGLLLGILAVAGANAHRRGERPSVGVS